MNKEYIFFDLDGTLVDSSKGIFFSLDRTFKKMGLPPMSDEKKCRYIGPPLEKSFTVFNDMTKEKAAEAVKIFRKYYGEEGTYLHRLYDGMESALKALKKKGKILAVATSKPEKYAKIIIEGYKLDKYFDVISGAEDDGPLGSKEYVLRNAINRLNIEDYDRCVLVGDTVNDVIGANQVGIDCIGVLYGFGEEKDLLESGAVDIAELPEDIVRIID